MNGTTTANIIWSIGGGEDSAAVARLAAVAFDPCFREAWNESQIAAIAATSSGWLELGHAVDGELLAFALNRQITDEAELLLCAIHPRARRQGIGRDLIEKTIASSRKRAISRIFLEVRASNVAAQQLYHACGFVACGKRPGYYRSVSGEMIDAITLERSL